MINDTYKPAPLGAVDPAGAACGRAAGAPGSSSLAEGNRKILEAARRALGQKMWLDYAHTVENGRLGCAASLTKVLETAGLPVANSDLVTDMVAQLKRAGFAELPLSRALPGDIVYGTEPGVDATAGGGHAHIGVVGEYGTCYDNRAATGLWSCAVLTEIFSASRFGDKLWVLRAPAELERCLGKVACGKGDYQAAIRHFSDAVANGECRGAQDHGFASDLHDLAVTYRLAGDYAQAEKVCRRALSLRRAMFAHLDVVASLEELATIHECRRRYAQAERLLERALEITEQLCGAWHDKVPEILERLGRLYAAQAKRTRRNRGQKLRQAVEHLEKALAIRRETTGVFSAGFYRRVHELACAYAQAGRLEEAAHHFRWAVALKESAFGWEHLELISSLEGLAQVCRAQHDFPQAEKALRRALAIAEGSASQSRAQMRDQLTRLAELYADMAAALDCSLSR